MNTALFAAHATRESLHQDGGSASVSDLVELGERYEIDSGVLLGYLTGREIASTLLRIGPRARIRSGTVLYAGSTIGAGLQTGHSVVIREENIIGDNLNIWNNSTIDYGCVIGSNVKIHNNVYVAQFTIIEDDVFLAPGVMVANDPHPLCAHHLKGPTIKRGARVGINVTLLPGVVIGEGAMIGAGSVVTRDVPPHMVAFGNPARPHKPVDEVMCEYQLAERGERDGQAVEHDAPATDGARTPERS